MLYRTMPKNNDQLSILGFGCMRLPQPKGSPGTGKIDEARAAKQIHYAVEQGVNYFDTALPYHRGGSEPFLGRVFANGSRNKVKLATKLPPWFVKTSDDMERVFTKQLRNLQTDRIEYYLLHGLDGHNWPKIKALNVAEFLNTLKRSGRILHAGFSFHGDLKAFKEIVDDYDWDFCQIQYNFLDEHNQAGSEGLEYAAAKDLGVIVMEPLRGGNLAQKPPTQIETLWNEAQAKRTPVEWALRWVWNRPEVTLVLSGMNEEAQIEENIRIANAAHPNSLQPQEIQLVERVAALYRSLMKVGCTGCCYCMPCPAGVNIPACFEVYNSHHIFKNRQAKMMYLVKMGGMLEGKPGFASQCTVCGKCATACPQHLPVPELLREVRRELEGVLTKPLSWGMRQMFGFYKWNTLRKARRPL